ncbi:hypothetical protein [Marinobacterium rhizophilum]|uniref:hypothetical protein n=1 Tax=Marinobacterium rhizophilum TaxID=420402 RepID=UPI00035F76D7|nr:hypothetical protein [Marinobacterium rhizophilum]
MMRMTRNALPVALLLTAFSVAAMADKPEHKHDKKDAHTQAPKQEVQFNEKHEAGSHSNRTAESVLLAPLAGTDRDYIRHYLGSAGGGVSDTAHGGAKSLPPGLQKKLERGGDLPPGWQDKVARGEVLEPDLMRRAHRLPADLNLGLQGYSAGTELLLLEDRVVRIATGQGTVLDVIDIADLLIR